MISLEELLSQISQEDYLKHSRVHPLPIPDEGRTWHIKREDELGFFAGGSKIRKWRTLIPALVNAKVDTAILIGSAYSNNVLGLTLLLQEKGIKPLPLLLKAYEDTPKGNRLFIELSSKPIYLERKEWPQVESVAETLKAKLEGEGKKVEIIPEGSYMKEAFYGALTLALDIVQNEKDLGKTFDHIFIDAGTGLQAQALILGLCLLNHKALVSVLLLHEDPEKFRRELDVWSEMLGISDKPRFNIFFPKGQRGFRPLEGKAFEEIIHFARKTGVWTDPLYSGRLVQEAPLYAQTKEMQGNILIVHTGGLTALFGFQDALTKSFAIL